MIKDSVTYCVFKCNKMKYLSLIPTKFLLVVSLVILSGLYGMAVGQAPASIKYQAVVRDGSGNILPDQEVTFRFSIIQGTLTGTIVYSETQATTSNSFGLVNLEIGKGSVVSGTFEGINWGADRHFLRVEMDPSGGSAYQLFGESELLSVPYALHAKTVEKGDNWGIQTVATDVSLDGAGTLASPLKLGHQRALNGQVLKFNGLSWAPGTDIAGSTDPGGSNGQVQFNQAGAFGGDENLFWNNSTKRLGIGTNTPAYPLSIRSGGGYPEVHLTSDWSGHTNIDGLRIGMGNLSTWIWSYEDTKIAFGTNNQERMAILSTGDLELRESLKLKEGKKISIGVDDPYYPLEFLNGPTTYAKFYHTTSGTNTSDGLLTGITQTGNRSYFWNYEEGPIYFGTNNVLRMAIVEDGKIGIGTNTPDFKLDINGNLNLNRSIASGQALLVNGSEAIWFNGTYFSWGYGGNYNYFADNVTIGTSANPGFDLVVNGTAAKTGGGSWSNLSDRRLKNIKGDYTRGLEEVIALRPVRFTYREDNPLGLNSSEEQVGFIAQDVQLLFPEAIHQGAQGYLDFNMHSVNVALVNAVRELKAENDRLKSENRKLESRITRIENYLQAEARKK